MKTADLLKREHDAILKFLDVLEHIRRHMGAEHDVPQEDLAIMIDFIVSFIVKYHQAREETIIFPAMEKAGILHRNGPIGSAIAQHHAQLGYVRLMEDSLGHVPFHRDKFLKASGDYDVMLRSHIEKEINEILPDADSKLDQSVTEKMGRELEQFDITVTGKSRLDDLYNIPVLLNSAYPE